MSTTFNFPANPTLNQQVTLPNGSIAQWNGTEWVSVNDSNITYPLPINQGGTGATTPSQARFNLGLNTATGEFVVQKDGTVAAPGIAFASEPGLGWFRQRAGLVAFASNGVTVSYINSETANSVAMAVTPRVTGTASLLLGAYPNGSPDQSTLIIESGPTGYTMREQVIAAGTNRPLNLTFSQGVTVNGTLTIAKTGGQLSLKIPGAATDAAFINSVNSAGQAYWTMNLAEGNAGKNFTIYRYNPVGTLVTAAMTIDRVSGLSSFEGVNTNSLTSLGGATFSGARVSINSQTLEVHNASPNTPKFSLVQDGVAGRSMIATAAAIMFLNAAESGGTHSFENDGVARKLGATVWDTFSDARIKDVHEDYTNGLDAILALRPVWYSYKKETGLDYCGRMLGLVAQEAMVPMPEMVKTKTEKFGRMQVDDLHTLDASPVIWALVNAIKTINQRLKAIGA